MIDQEAVKSGSRNWSSYGPVCSLRIGGKTSSFIFVALSRLRFAQLASDGYRYLLLVAQFGVFDTRVQVKSNL